MVYRGVFVSPTVPLLLCLQIQKGYQQIGNLHTDILRIKIQDLCTIPITSCHGNRGHWAQKSHNFRFLWEIVMLAIIFGPEISLISEFSPTYQPRKQLEYKLFAQNRQKKWGVTRYIFSQFDRILGVTFFQPTL